MTVESTGTGLTMLPKGRALRGSSVSVKTDIEFVVLPLGGAADLFQI